MNNPYIIEKLKEQALLDRIAELETKMAELEVLAKKDNFPQVGDTYWYINTFGGVSYETWGGNISERDMLEIGNIFRTKGQAEFEVEKLKVVVELRKFSVPFKHGGDNYTFNYNHKNGKIVNLYASEGYQDFGALYFESNEELNKAIKSVGEDRIKKYIFGV